MMYMNVPIGSGWKIIWNWMPDIDPSLLSSDDKRWLQFTEDLLYIQSADGRYMIDVGWYPEMNPSGIFGLYVIENNDWANPVESVSDRNMEKIIARVTAFCNKYGG